MKLHSISSELMTYPMRPTTGGPLSKEAINLLPGAWAYEPKVNGWRGVIHVPTLSVFNRHGKPLSIVNEFNEALPYLWETTPSDIEWLDCEMLGRRHSEDQGKIVVLDIIEELYFYEVRRAIITDTWMLTPGLGEPVTAIPSVTDPFELWNHLQEENKRLGCDYYEGVVGKRIGTGYETQLVSALRTTPHWIKYRFDQYTEL